MWPQQTGSSLSCAHVLGLILLDILLWEETINRVFFPPLLLRNILKDPWEFLYNSKMHITRCLPALVCKALSGVPKSVTDKDSRSLHEFKVKAFHWSTSEVS